MLYEQLLVQEATTIASKYPDPYRAQYLAAAKTLRSPYWDWSADSNVPPCTVPTSLTITVPASGGVKKMSIANPLQSYQFPQAAINGRFGQFPRAPRTVRCPAPQSYPQSANQALNTRGLKQNTVSWMARLGEKSCFSQLLMKGYRYSVRFVHLFYYL